ncbi:MAG: hypothetical protein AB1347_09535 [Acidobacteriota bacterium]
MRRATLFAGLAALLLAGIAVVVGAQETEGSREAVREPAVPSGAAREPMEPGGTSWGLDLDLTSRYLWRGLVSSHGAVAQGDVWVSAGGFTASFWGNWDPDPFEGSGRFNELDADLAYERPAGPVTLGVRYVHLSYPDQPGVPSTGEASLEAELDLGGGFGLGTHQIWDVEACPGSYYGDLFLAKGLKVGGGELQAAVSVGWGSRSFHEAYYEVDYRGFTVGSATLAWEAPLGERWVVRPHAEVGVLLNPVLRKATGRRAVASAGVCLGWTF